MLDAMANRRPAEEVVEMNNCVLVVVLALLAGVLLGCHSENSQKKSIEECVADLAQDDEQVRLLAITELGQRGWDAEGAVPHLAAIADSTTESPKLRNAADEALTRIGLAFELEALHTSADFDVRHWYASALGRWRHYSDYRDKSTYLQLAIPALLRVAEEDADARIRDMAILGLGALPAEEAAREFVPVFAERTVAVFIKSLNDPDRELRVSAVIALGDYRDYAEVAVPRLRAMLDFEDAEVQKHVQRTIRFIEARNERISQIGRAHV